MSEDKDQTIDELALGTELVIEDENGQEHSFTCEGHVDVTFEGDEEKRYFINVRENGDDVQYLVTDKAGVPLEDDSKADTVLHAWLDHLQKSIEDEEQSKEK